LVSVTVTGKLVRPTASFPKLTAFGVSVTGNKPTPVKEVVCGLPAALSVTFNVPVRVPGIVGVKVTLIVQLAPAARVAGETGQLFVWAKSPVVAMLLMVMVWLPEVFLKVATLGELVVLITCVPYDKLVGVRVAV